MGKLRGADAPLSFSYLAARYFLFRYLWYSSSSKMLSVMDKTAGIATTHKFSSMLMPRRWMMERPIRIITSPTPTHPAARKMYSLIMVRIIIGCGLL